MNYEVVHQNKAISEQSSKFLCNTDDYGIMHHNKTISKWSSEFLCVTDKLWNCVYYKAYMWTYCVSECIYFLVPHVSSDHQDSDHITVSSDHLLDLFD